MGEPRTAKAKLKEVSAIDPRLLCCDGMRESLAKHADIVIEIIPERRVRDIRHCHWCKTQHEVTGILMVEKVSGCGMVAAEFIDIDEGGR